MRRRSAVLLGMAFILAAAHTGTPSEKQKKPRLDLRASPRMAFSPVNVLLTAELTGGDAVDDYYCPEIEWDWDDGGRSVHQEDCSPIESGAEMSRRFTANHAYRQAGTYNVKFTMRHAARPVAVASAVVTVRPGLGDLSADNN